MSDALNELCRLTGIQPEYDDIWGKRHTISHDTQEALLVAMGVKSGADSPDTALTRFKARTWSRLVPPVCVIRGQDSPIKITIRLPVSLNEETVRWRLIPETGKAEVGSARFADLEELERQEIDGTPMIARAFTLPMRPPLGYHRFEVQSEKKTESTLLVVAPLTCFVPEALAGEGRTWGPAIQLYALRSRRNWGIGDFTDLKNLATQFAGLGAGIVGVNPLHALFPHNPEHASPYSPSSRLFLNVLYIDVEAVSEFAECAAMRARVHARGFQKELEQLRAENGVNYRRVVAAKFSVLEMLYQFFREHHWARNTERAKAFKKFQHSGGESLARHALWEALQEYFHRKDPKVWGWPTWPVEFRNPDAPAVRKFNKAQRERVEFYMYLQWQVAEQLEDARRACDVEHMAVGLYQDLAISVDRAGAEAWAEQTLFAQGASIGSPPDAFNMKGQNWGLPPLIPYRLQEAGYGPFIATLRRGMRDAGALRVDHVMGLMRLFCIPEGRLPTEGAYIHYPFSDLLGILALESQRNRCLVIGEDLGTVPREVTAALAPMNVLSYRLFYFERDQEENFKPPRNYPAQALAAVSTHDLPTLAGYWKGIDLIERAELGLFPSQQAHEQQILVRAQDRARMLLALAHEKLLPESFTLDPASNPEMSPELARAVQVYVARSPAKVMMVQLEDILGQLRQVNLPATNTERPNWREKLALYLEDLVTDPRTRALVATLKEVRGSGAIMPATAQRIPKAMVIPQATYRLQFHRDFTFAHATELIPYLHRLGVSHIYASPYLKARPGSRHGYDIVDHNALNPEIGGEEDYERMVQALRAHDMGQILDIVPNHMGIGSDNAWWLDVLENGPASIYAEYFDIDWRSLKDELRGKVLLPVLGDYYGKSLEAGQLRLMFDGAAGAFSVHYYEHRFPIDPGTYPQILEQGIARLEAALGAGHARFIEFQTLIAAFRHLPKRNELAAARLIERNRDKDVHKKRLAELCAGFLEIQRHVDAMVAFYNGADGKNARLDLIHALLEAQAYRVAYWRVAADEINYRRFFDINDLAGLRMENPSAFDATHRLIGRLVTEGKVDGLRIDHPDGLYDPVEYYRRLQSLVTLPHSESEHAALYVVAEKILAAYERVPEHWAVHGTTGYDFANLVNGVLVHQGAERDLDRFYTRFTGQELNFDELLYARKKVIMQVALSSELHVLANVLNRISESDWYARDFTLTALRHALLEVVACFPVYRTYVSGTSVTAEDRRYVDWAVASAKKRSPAGDVSIFDFIRSNLLLDGLDTRPEEYRRAVVDFAMRFQQYTSPVMAKSLEDTSFYIYNRLVSLNEVGGDPRRFGVSVAAFHHANQERARRWPHSMSCSSSHDNKRSEDVRARIDVLTEMAPEWRTHVMHWSKLNRNKKSKLEHMLAPSRNDEYFLYQTLIGAWPIETQSDWKSFAERIEAYMLKAVKEAKVHTSWINPNTEYEEAVCQFVRALLNRGQKNLFLADFLPFQRRIARVGFFNSLSQVALKLMAPGVPDIYQGNELWDLSLVDPDNRRPVDYRARERLLAGFRGWDRLGGTKLSKTVRELISKPEDGRAKLYLTWKALNFRRVHPEVFAHGDYTPLAVAGSRAEHVCAFARRRDACSVVVVVPRCYAKLIAAREAPLGRIWSDTWVEVPLADAKITYNNLLTGETIRAQRREGKTWLACPQILADFPVALLEVVSD